MRELKRLGDPDVCNPQLPSHSDSGLVFDFVQFNLGQGSGSSARPMRSASSLFASGVGPKASLAENGRSLTRLPSSGD